MADNTHEFTGKSVDEAVAAGLAQLKLSRSEVAVEVISKGSRGIFGIGSELARVRISVEPKAKSTSAPAAVVPAPTEAPIEEETADAPAEPVFDADDSEEDLVTEEPEPESESTGEAQTAQPETDDAGAVSDEELETMAAEMLGEIVRLMGFEADVVTSWQESDEPGTAPFLLLDIEGEDLGSLIGRRGETLASLQYLVRLMVNQRIKQWRNIVVDVEKYKERREKQLTQLALRMADQVADSGRAAALEPMPPNERRLVHIALRDHDLVYTQSSGEGDRRKVNIVPRDTA